METQFITDALRSEFLGRCKKNESYSLRAYAKYLGVDHSLLSKIVKGQKPLSKSMAFRVGEKLGMSSSQVSRSFEITNKILQSQKLNEDVYIMMSDWYHFAILELVKTENFKYCFLTISKIFGISILEVEQAFIRLQRLGFLVINKDKSTVKLTKPNNNWFNHQNTTQARKILQKQLLKKALTSIDNVDFTKRANSSLTIAIDPKDLPSFKKHIQEFMDKSDKLAESTKGRKKEVYQLCVAFYPLTLEETL